MVPQPSGFGRHNPSRPPVALWTPRCAYHAPFLTQRGGSRGFTPAILLAARATRSPDRRPVDSTGGVHAPRADRAASVVEWSAMSSPVIPVLIYEEDRKSVV